jgi:hypothetical protein
MTDHSSKPKLKATPNPTTHTHTTATETPALPTVLPNGEDLDSLHTALGKPQESFTRMLFRTAREEDLVEQGARVDSLNIVADVPRFVASSLAILEALDPARRATVMLPFGIFAVIVDEAVRLDGMKVDHEQTAVTGAGEKAEREATLRQEMRNGVALREQATAALGHALGDDRMKELDVIVGDASSPASLVKGMNAVAAFIDRVLANGDAAEAESLAAWHVAAPRAVALRAQAVTVKGAGAVVANTGRRVSQRSLDLQDGRVLLLIEQTLRAFRTAHRADRSILVPELNRIAWLFETRSTSRKSSKAAAQPAPAAPPAIGTDPQ